MKNKNIYDLLVSLAKNKKIITYEDLVITYRLDINLELIDDRNKLSHILGEISKQELDSKPQRPPISVLVVLKNKLKNHNIMPSYGFFNYMDKLGIRKPKESDEELRNRLMNWCYNYWSTK